MDKTIHGPDGGKMPHLDFDQIERMARDYGFLVADHSQDGKRTISVDHNGKRYVDQNIIFLLRQEIEKDPSRVKDVALAEKIISFSASVDYLNEVYTENKKFDDKKLQEKIATIDMSGKERFYQTKHEGEIEK